MGITYLHPTANQTMSCSLSSCSHCNKPVAYFSDDPIDETQVVKEQSGNQVAEFGQTLCEWLPRYSYNVIGIRNCIHCGKPNNCAKWLFETQEQAEFFRDKLVKSSKYSS